MISYVLQWTSWDFRLLQWTPDDFRGLQWTAWDFNGLQGDFRGLHGTPDDYNGLQMTPEDFSRLHGLHGIADEFSDIQLKSLVLPPPSLLAGPQPSGGLGQALSGGDCASFFLLLGGGTVSQLNIFKETSGDCR